PATDTEGKTEAEGLPKGLYLVAQTDVSSADTGSAHTLIADGCHPFLISLPMTNQAALDGHEAGSVWQYDVWAYPKNSTVGITKNLVAEDDSLIESDDFTIGDTIRQVITTDVPVMQGDRAFEKFAVTDTMENGLTFLADSLKVSVGDDAFSEENVVLTKDTDYVLSQDDSSFTVTLTENGLSKLNGLTAPSKLFVAFEARLNGTATIGIDTNDNTPKLSLKEKNSSEIEVGGNTPRSATYEMNISKEFASLTEPDYSKVSFEMTDAAGETILWTLEENGNYHPHYAAEEGDGSSLIIPDADGKIVLRGLDEGDYVLTEITTIPGQNLLAEPIRVHLEGNDPVDGALKSASIQNGHEEAITLTNEDELNLGIASFSIVNNRAVSLLRTGGTGSRWLYAIGGILLLGGAAAAWKGRKWLTLTAF
ncbi:MAG: SpaH/EbpB family LPXTG-anchored major pilin, partial [Lachnospiraceae bacterium]|nr:SpaH/EbpB family LPXTG-anchored major pilin [Candidatus Equihabitans merdae]